MKRKSMHSLPLITIISSLVVFSVGCSSTVSTSGQEDLLPAVKAIKAGEAGESGLIASGKITADEEIQVVSKLPGKVAQVHVKEGMAVRQGDVLVQLDATDYIQQLKQSESGLKSAQAKLADTKAGTRSQELQRLESNLEQIKAVYDSAQKNYDRMKALYDTGAISQAEFERISLELDKARTGYEQGKAQLDLAKAGATPHTIAALQAEVDRMKASVDLAKNTLDSAVVTAPISGIIARRSIDPGEMAQPGVPLLTIVKMDQVKVEASVPQDHINQIKVGSEVQVKVNGLDKTFTGAVDFVSPISDPNSSTFPVKIRVKNQDGLLRAGMLAEVYLAGKTESKLKLPASAVFKKADKSYVFKLDGDVVHQVEVTTDGGDRDWVEISSGVNADDLIVINPSGKLADGSKVRVK
jgi:multidrug efflux pump subunit AcrA (membrane-fusion protein)